MTLIDALKTGRRIRNKDFKPFCEWVQRREHTIFHDKEILSDKWEVEDSVVEIEGKILHNVTNYAYRWQVSIDCDDSVLSHLKNKKVKVRVEVIE